MKFGEYLRAARDKTGWTQPEAAAKIGIEQSYLSKMETGKSYPSEEIFEELVKAYDISVSDMSDTVSSDELDKLHDISSIRVSVLKQQQTKTLYVRSWMLAGLFMIMAGSGMLIGQNEISETTITTYRYESKGVIHADEPLLIFDLIMRDGEQKTGNCSMRKMERTPDSTEKDEDCLKFYNEASNLVASRTNYDIMDTTEYLGPTFILPLEDGNRRRYKLDKEIVTLQKSWLDYLHAIGVALIIGGCISCFYISRNWR